MSSPTEKRPIQWNEDNLRENEIIQAEIIQNMKDKGQSIDEPKTPYRYSDSDDECPDKVFEEEQFKQKLHDALIQKQSEWDTDDEEDKPKSPSKEEEFNKKRKQHYNEYRVLQRMRKQINNDEDEDDDFEGF